MKRIVFSILLSAFFCSLFLVGKAQTTKEPKFRVLAFYEGGGHHVAYSKRAVEWLDKLAADSNFAIDYTKSTSAFTDDFLSKYQLLIQLDFVPYAWKEPAMEAFKKYITEGKGGWIGFHHSTLLGDFDGYKMWPWFSEFMGGIKYKNYIPDFASGKVNVEDKKHPVMKGVPSSFKINKEEWYIYDKSPRPNVHVIASVDESTYAPDSVKVRMGDHPVVWTNEKIKAKNIYIFMGHGPDLFDNPAYVTLFRNAIFWASKK